VGAQPVAEQEHPVDLLAAVGEDVEVRRGFPPAQHPVLVPVRLADAKRVAGRLECRDIARLIRRVGHHEDDIDARLGGQAGHRRRADMLEAKHPPGERAGDPRRLRREQPGPGRIVLDDLDPFGQPLRLADGARADLLVGHVSARVDATPLTRQAT